MRADLTSSLSNDPRLNQCSSASAIGPSGRGREADRRVRGKIARHRCGEKAILRPAGKPVLRHQQHEQPCGADNAEGNESAYVDPRGHLLVSIQADDLVEP